MLNASDVTTLELILATIEPVEDRNDGEVGRDETGRGGRRLRTAAARWHLHPGPANWHSGADTTLRWLFKQVNWPGHQGDGDRWMEAERREIWGQENVTRGEGGGLEPRRRWR